MNGSINRRNIIAALTAAIVFFSTMSLIHAQTRVSVGVPETMETFNPYGGSVALLYAIWCQVMGCLVTYDFDKGEYAGMLAERWEVKTGFAHFWPKYKSAAIKLDAVVHLIAQLRMRRGSILLFATFILSNLKKFKKICCQFASVVL